MNTPSSPTLDRPAPAASPGGIARRVGLVVALAALLTIVWMPALLVLPPAGQVMLTILAFAVIVWMTEALDYPLRQGLPARINRA